MRIAFPLAEIDQISRQRADGFKSACLAKAVQNNGKILELEEEDFTTISRQYPSVIVKPDPRIITQHNDRLRRRFTFSPGLQSTDPHLPSLGAMAGNLAAAARRAGMSVITPGQKTIRTESEQSAILKICNTSGPAGAPCPYLRQADQRCSKCGCYTQWKSKLATEHCPDRPPKW
jgi:hypothetical protein